MAKNKEDIGNPLVYAAAASTLEKNSPVVIKGIGTGLKVVAVAGLGFLGYKWYVNYRKNKLMQGASSDVNVAAAMDIYQAIPAGYKKGDGSLFNPFGFVGDVLNKIATLWELVDRQKIINCGKKITDLQYCYKVFNQLYGENLRPMLQRALTPDDLNSFENLAKTKGTSASSTPVSPAHKFAVVTASSGVRLRSTPIVPMIPGAMYPIGNVVGIAPFGKIVGYTTGIETMSPDNKTIFVQIKAGSKKKMKTNGNVADLEIYGWKGAFEFLTHQEFNAKYGKMTDKWYLFP